MKKISAIMFGACALLTFSACSNDDPVVDNGGNVDDKGDYVYLAVKINAPGAQGSRAADDPFGYEYGTENAVSTAHFYFYNADGNYANITTSSWTPGDPSTDKPAGSIEYKSKGTIVIQGIKGGNYPKYMVTVLNQDFGTADNPKTFTAPEKLTGWAELTDWNCKNSKGEYVMTTSSYLDGTDRVSNNGSCYATELKDTDFLEQAPNEANFDDVNRVNVYVERLAARVNVNISLEPATGEGVAEGLYETKITVGGETNPDAKTPLYVKFDGWTLYATANSSRASKSLEGYTADTKFETTDPASNIAWKWNDAPYWRSYWGKSAVWGLTDLSGHLNTTLYYPGIKTNFATAMYCNECTNEYDKIITSGKYADPTKTTTVIVAATVCDKGGNGLDLVEYRGVKYLPADFVRTVLNSLNLGCYTRTEDPENGPYNLADGTTLTIYKYNQITESDVELFLPGDADKNGAVVIKVKDAVELWNPGDPVTETLDLADGGSVTVTYHKNATQADKGIVNTSFANRVKEGNANAYKSGKMYYPIVIEHLNYAFDEGKKVVEKQVTRDGMVGVVRNHAYTINITKINNLGTGVYNPGTADENGEIIKPQPGQDPTYYLESTINILSWKLVNQDAEI